MISEEDLRRMYWDEKMSTPEIAKLVGVSGVTIRDWMKRCGIPIRTMTESQLVNTLKLSKKELQQMYWDKEIGIPEIARLVGVDPATIYTWMKNYDIPRRTFSEAQIGCNIVVPTKEELYGMYWDKNMNRLEIAENVGVGVSTIGRWMELYNISRRTLSEAFLLVDNSGPNSPSWKGGPKKYCYKFNDRLKEAVRERDDYTCQNCGKTQEEDIRKLSVHHVHYDTENCYPDLICLCTECHPASNNNRDWWETHCMCILAERGLLGWKPPWSE